MYISPDAQSVADELFTPYEQLYGKLTPERVLELVTRPDAKIIKLDYDRNSYGHFWFITFDVLNKGRFQFYGIGENTSSDCFQRDFREVSVVFIEPKNVQHVGPTLPREKDLELIRQFRDIIERSPARNGIPKTKFGAIFSMLEDLTDSDSAYAYLEECMDLDFCREE